MCIVCRAGPVAGLLVVAITSIECGRTSQANAISRSQPGAPWSAVNRGWFWQNPLPQGNNLWSVAALDASTFIAVGEFGTILRTSDGGTTWTKQDSGTQNRLFGVAFGDGNNGTAVGD